MRRNLGVAMAFVVGLLVFSGAAFAQEMTIQPLLGTYDMLKLNTKTGLITDLTWANTHCVLFFDAKNDDGKVVNWSIELTNPRTLIAMGVTPAALAAGKEVTVTFYPSIDGTNHGLVKLVKTGDKVVFDANKGPSELAPTTTTAKKK
jgi:hypothetical protein